MIYINDLIRGFTARIGHSAYAAPLPGCTAQAEILNHRPVPGKVRCGSILLQKSVEGFREQ
jgi:hypothetical protein